MKHFLKAGTIIFFALFSVIACKKDTEVNDSIPDPANLTDMISWNYASVPLRFAESNLNNNKAYGFNRAKISWYNIDPTIFYSKSANLRPPNLSKDDMSEDDCRVIYVNELFPSKENQYNQPLTLNVFSIDYYPEERGPWNYDAQSSAYSAGIGYDGKLNEPSTRWAGITRELEIAGFKTNYLDFWLLDPFTTYPDANGELYFDIGDISEDVLKDGLLSSENTGEGAATSTAWGLVRPLLNSNSSTFVKLPYDKGLDELADTDETAHFSSYLDEINSICSPTFYASVYKDPANDDYHSYLGDDYTSMNYNVRDRYKNYNNEENNCFSAMVNVGNYQVFSNTEDINNNDILDTLNNYFEYKISINKGSFVRDANFIVGIFDTGVENPTRLENGSLGKTKFYHFRIPLTEFSGSYGSPSLSPNPKFIRLYLKGFSTPVNLRFINLMFSEDVIVYTH